MSDKLPTNYGSPTPAPLPSYGGDQPTYGGGPSADEQNLKMLMNSVPGTPGEDYPILSEVPETAFSCKGQKVGGDINYIYIYITLLSLSSTLNLVTARLFLVSWVNLG